MSAVSQAGWDALPEGATVTCEVEQGRQGPQVWRIHSVDASTAFDRPGEDRGCTRAGSAAFHTMSGERPFRPPRPWPWVKMVRSGEGVSGSWFPRTAHPMRSVT